MSRSDDVKWKIIEDLMDLNAGFDQYGNDKIVVMVDRVVKEHSGLRVKEIRAIVREELNRMFVKGELSRQMRFEV
jgi:hypothetical protein